MRAVSINYNRNTNDDFFRGENVDSAVGQNSPFSIVKRSGYRIGTGKYTILAPIIATTALIFNIKFINIISQACQTETWRTSNVYLKYYAQ